MTIKQQLDYAKTLREFGIEDKEFAAKLLSLTENLNKAVMNSKGVMEVEGWEVSLNS